MQVERYSSPHPHPDHLERFAALYPDAPKIVFESFREQGEHRRARETQHMNGSERRANIGQWLAFVLVAAVIGAGIFAVAVDEAGAGATMISVGLGGGILLAISGNFQQPMRPVRKDRSLPSGTTRAKSEIENGDTDLPPAR